jgi:hypothetical protein
MQSHRFAASGRHFYFYRGCADRQEFHIFDEKEIGPHCKATRDFF